MEEEYCPNPSKLNRRAKHLKLTLDKFWKRWKKEYLLELRNYHCVSQTGGGKDSNVQVSAVVTVYDDSHPRGLWRLGVVKALITVVDGVVRGAQVRVVSKKGRPVLL